MTTEKSNTPKSNTPKTLMRELGLTHLPYAKELESLLESLSCFNGFLDALSSKTSKEIEPESECLTDFPYWCGDCETYHQKGYTTGFRAEEGRLFADFHSCDEDGDWDCYNSFDLFTEEGWHDYLISLKDISWERAESEWQGYYQYVAREGKDPLKNLLIKDEDSVAVLLIAKEHQGRAYLAAIGLPGDAPAWMGFIKDDANWMTYFGKILRLEQTENYFYIGDFTLQSLYQVLTKEGRRDNHGAHLAGDELRFNWTVELKKTSEMYSEELKKAAERQVSKKD